MLLHHFFNNEISAVRRQILLNKVLNSSLTAGVNVKADTNYGHEKIILRIKIKQSKHVFYNRKLKTTAGKTLQFYKNTPWYRLASRKVTKQLVKFFIEIYFVQENKQNVDFEQGLELIITKS